MLKLHIALRDIKSQLNVIKTTCKRQACANVQELVSVNLPCANLDVLNSLNEKLADLSVAAEMVLL